MAAADTAATDRAATDTAAKQAAAQQTMAMLLSLSVSVPDQVAPDSGAPRQAVPGPAVLQKLPLQKLPLQKAALQKAAPMTSAGQAHAWTGLGTARAWPVGVILAGQAAGSVRLIWSNSASAAEARYLLAVRIQHLAPGAPRPAGPVLAALAGAVTSTVASGVASTVAGGDGGLVVARLESLALMLAATVLVHGMTRRLFDRRSAFFAAALFGGLAGATFLGAVAGSGALALAALAAAAWLGIRAAATAGWPQLALAAAAGAALAAANLTAYAAVPGDLVVLTVTALAVWQASGGAAAARATAASIAVAGLVITAAVVLTDGPAAWPEQTRLLLSRAVLASPGLAWTTGGPPLAPAQATVRWAGVLALLAVAGALVKIAARQGGQAGAGCAVLAAAVAVAPGCYGAWFACASGGYAVASLARAVPRAKSAAAFAAGLALVILIAVPGVPLAARQFGWADAAPVTARIPAVLASQPGPVLADDADVLRYYLGPDLAARTVVAGPDCTRRPGPAACRAAIRRRYFGVIALVLPRGSRRGAGLAPSIALAGYRQVAQVPYGTTAGVRGSWIIWVRGRQP